MLRAVSVMTVLAGRCLLLRKAIRDVLLGWPASWITDRHLSAANDTRTSGKERWTISRKPVIDVDAGRFRGELGYVLIDHGETSRTWM